MDRNRGTYIRLISAAAVLALALAAAIFSHYRLETKKQGVYELRAEMTRLQDAIDRGRLLAAKQLPAAQRTVLSDQAGVGDLLENLSGQLVSLNLSDRSIQTMPPVNTKRWQRFPLALSCKGEFTQTLRFLREIEQINPLIRVDRVAINREPHEPQMPLTLRFSLSAYARREVTP